VRKLTLLLLIFIGLLQYRLWFGDGNLRELHRMQNGITELEQEGERRKQRNAAVEAEVNDLKRGTDAIEESARQNLGMIKEGEVFIQVVDEQPRPEAPPAKKQEKPRPKAAPAPKR
jgi:cell division protein FtsB